ncbi:unnamed protein product [Ambrosiozyma monospora]|uniref:Unnamed protein product n=1 Tax=Ambrosiozyma monospora TaxID=43982 RepID=A0A9W7DH24_AMBMO|nr:unnamed protein product [Ambrosiozyma monospora]
MYVIPELNKLEHQSPSTAQQDLLSNNAVITCSFPLIEVPDDIYAMSRILNISLDSAGTGIRITKAFSDLFINGKCLQLS